MSKIINFRAPRKSLIFVESPINKWNFEVSKTTQCITICR